jgi:hypothetical protein
MMGWMHSALSCLRIILAALLFLVAVSVAATVRINEFMASNGATIADEDGDYEDWIELHNYGDAPVSLAGWGLSDNAGNPFKWTFSGSTVLAPGGFFLVWASGKDRGGAGPADGPEPLAPESVDGLVLRLRAADVQAADGAAVATWPDGSVHGNDAVQPIPARRPVFVADGLNGRPVLRFNRAAVQQFFLPTSGFSGMQDFTDFTLLAVIRWTGGARSGLLGGYRGGNTANAGSSVIEISDTGGGFRLRLPPGIDFTAPGALPLNQWCIAGAVMDGTLGRARLTRDGALLAEADGSVGQTLLAQYERVPVGSSHDDSRTFGGEIAELLLYNRGLSADEQERVELYLNSHYGLAAPAAPARPQTSFRISAQGEPLLLTRPDGTAADFVDPVAVPRDISRGRIEDDPDQWAYYYAPTPGAANATTPFTALIEPVTLSQPAGAHHGPFDLVLSHPDPGATILYTLDGSEPDIGNLGGNAYVYVNSYPNGPLLQNTVRTFVYDGPIRVTDRSGQPDRLARISSTKDSSPSYFPLAPVKKGTVVRARAHRDGAAGPMTTRTYFVSATGAFSYDMPVLSLSVDEGGLFDFYDGIHVAGVDHVTQSGARICDWGNYNRRGGGAEVPAHAEFFAGGSPFLEQAAGVRIQGNCSRMRPLKSLRLYGRNSGDDDGLFDFPFFADPVPGATRPDNTRFQRLILRTPNFHDTAFSRLYQGVFEGVAGRVQPVQQFINGEYWGMAFARDRFDPEYLEQYYGLDPDNITIIEISYRHEFEPIPVSFSNRLYTLASGVPADMTAFEEMRSFITGNDMSNPARYAEAAGRICIDSFIDHLILKIFAGDDHYAPEVIHWRARVPENDGFGDGRWRFFVKDFDSTLRTDNYVTGLATGTHPRPFGHELFTSLLANTEFRTRFINRFCDLLNTQFRTDRFIAIIQDAYDEVAPVWPEVTARWRNAELSNPDHPFTTTTRSNLIRWALQHPSRQRSHLRSHFSLPSMQELTVAASDPLHGFVQVNTVAISGDTPGLPAQPYPWKGLYFPGHPVELKALPAEGYRLLEWRVTPTAGGTPTVFGGPVLPLDVTQATTVEAVFAPLPPDFIELVAERPVTLSAPDWIAGASPGAAYSIASADEAVLAASVAGDKLLLVPLKAGETRFTVSATGGVGQPVTHTVRALVHGPPFAVAGGPWVFNEWDAGEPAGTYPPNMLFTQSDVSDPGLTMALLFAYRIPPADAASPVDVDFPYAASSRTRILGLGAQGIGFINTGRGRDLGAAVLSIDASGATDIRVAWTGGTLLPNSRVYALRLQYRVGLTGEWIDVADAHGAPVAYLRDASAGHNRSFGPVTLPAAVDNAPLLQLRWKYHHVSGTSGPRAALRLDDIVVAAGAPTRFADWQLLEIADPALRADPDFAGPEADPSESGITNFLRYALGLGLTERPRARLPVLFDTPGGLSYRFPLDSRLIDISYRVTVSEDLQDWNTVLFDSRLQSTPLPVNGWLELQLAPSDRRFYRLTVSPHP